MDTFSGLEVRELQLGLPFVRRRRDALLGRCGLQAEDADFAVGVFDAADALVATASLAGDTVRCVAVDSSMRGESLLPAMMSAIVSHAGDAASRLRVFTKPEYGVLFAGLGFSAVGHSRHAVLMDRDAGRLARYRDYLASLPRRGRVGCVVANANPMTLGHLYLIEQSARMADTLFVIPVADDIPGGFSYRERIGILRDATAAMDNVTVVEGSPFVVSRATFPSYFIKSEGTLSEAHIELDLDIFTRHIAPALGVSVRFVGTEPSDGLTAAYNRGMRRLLPPAGIEVHEFGRLEIGGLPVSASRVRGLLGEGDARQALRLVPPATRPALLGHAAARALAMELDLTPKPGLVDRANSGAHTDMDHTLMSRSIEALRLVFIRLAALGHSRTLPPVTALSTAGREGELAMMQATGGVNTHRGALFALGLTVVAAAHLLASDRPLTVGGIRGVIMRLAREFPEPSGTHGAGVRRRYGIPGALDAARSGYPEAVAALGIPEPQRMLLYLMSCVEDSNIYHRCGPETAAEVKALAARALPLPSGRLEETLRRMDAEFTGRRISPGGSADMLALALLIRSLTGGG